MVVDAPSTRFSQTQPRLSNHLRSPQSRMGLNREYTRNGSVEADEGGESKRKEGSKKREKPEKPEKKGKSSPRRIETPSISSVRSARASDLSGEPSGDLNGDIKSEEGRGRKCPSERREREPRHATNKRRRTS